MEQKVELKANERSEIGGKKPRTLRLRGFIPGVLYGGKKAALPLSIARSAQEKLVKNLHENQVLSLRFGEQEKGRPRLVIVKEIQRDHLSGSTLHIDFQEISLHEKLIATVPVVDVGESVGVSRDGGILQHVLREIEIRCFPDRIPESIEVDVSSLEIGDSIQVGDIKAGEDVEILTEPEGIVLTVTAPQAEEEVAPLEEEAEAAEVAAEEEEKKEEEAVKEEEGESGKTEETGGKGK